MSDPVDIAAVYLHLARASELRRRLPVRDRLLTLAAAVTTIGRLPTIAAYCRRKILAHNPRHLIGRGATVALAMQDETFLGVLRQLQSRYPAERAEQLLRGLGVERAEERAAYFSDEEYLAALLGERPESPPDEPRRPTET